MGTIQSFWKSSECDNCEWMRIITAERYKSVLEAWWTDKQQRPPAEISQFPCWLSFPTSE